MPRHRHVITILCVLCALTLAAVSAGMVDIAASASARARPITPTVCHDLFRRSAVVPVSFPGGPLTVGRFNADRRDDLAVSASGMIRVLLGNAGGGADVTRSVPEDAYLLSAGEFTGDGRSDLLAANDLRMSVWAGDGLGGFAPRSSIGVQPLQGQAIADLNADSRADIVLTAFESSAASRLRVLLGDGAGGFAESAAIPVAEGSNIPLVRDLDGDGHPDVLLSTRVGELAEDVQLFLGDGAGGLRAPVDATTWTWGAPVWSMALADFNEDQRVDLAITGYGIVTVLFGDGRGHFWEPSRRRLLVRGARSLQTADFDGDAHQDLVVSGDDSGDVFVFLGTGTGKFHPAPGTPEYGGYYPPAPATVGDFNGDGRPDIAGLRGGSQMSIRLLRNTGGHTPRGQRAQTIQMARPSPRRSSAASRCSSRLDSAATQAIWRCTVARCTATRRTLAPHRHRPHQRRRRRRVHRRTARELRVPVAPNRRQQARSQADAPSHRARTAKPPSSLTTKPRLHRRLTLRSHPPGSRAQRS